MEILDNVGKIVTDTYKSATQASGRLIEESKLKFLISDNESQMREIFENLGRQYYKSYSDGEVFDFSAFENDFEELRRMQLENEQAREKILNLKGYKKCVNCGKEIKNEYSFCQHCGEKQPEIKEEKKEEVKKEPVEKVCSNCNAKLDNEDAFCPFCGKNVE